MRHRSIQGISDNRVLNLGPISAFGISYGPFDGLKMGPMEDKDMTAVHTHSSRPAASQFFYILDLTSYVPSTIHTGTLVLVSMM